jgi:hypothetical protein
MFVARRVKNRSAAILGGSEKPQTAEIVLLPAE